MKPIAILATGALLLSASPPDVAAQSGHDLMQEALVQERTAANLEEAIHLYRQIVDEHASDRALAARALIRLGSVYEKLGRPEALEVYERVVSEYSDQEDAASEARERLAALRPPAAAADVAAEPAPPARRLVLDRAGNFNATLPTRDGRHLLRYNVESRGYELVEIGSGRTRQLTKAGPDPGQRLFRNHSLSPDERLIAAVHVVSANPESEPGLKNDGGRELRMFTVGGSGEGRLIHRWEPSHHVQVFGWSPDQTRIWVFVIRPDLAAEIATVDTASGSLAVLKTLVWRNLTQPPSLSPDGRFIAYHDADSRDAPADLFLLATDGSGEVRVEHPAHDTKPLFAPDGSGIVFRSNRKGGDLWFLPVVDGKPAGAPRAVWDDIGIFGTAKVFAENGSLFYFFATNGWEIYTADLQPTAGIIGAPEHIPPLHGEVNNAPAFSPDGRFLAHLRDRRRLVLRELATGVEREFPISGSVGVPALDWCPGSDAVIVSGHAAEWASFRVDVERGGAERLPLDGPKRVVCIDDKNVVYLRGIGLASPDEPSQVVSRSLVTGGETVLFEGRTHHYYLQRSPDGSRVSFLRIDGDVAELVVMPVAGGDPVPVASGIGADVGEFQGAMWTPDGESLLLAQAIGPLPRDEDSPEVELIRVAADGSSETQVGRMRLPAFERAYLGAWNYTLHPDGGQIAFERHAGLVAQRWAIDNLLQFIQSGATAPVADPRR